MEHKLAAPGRGDRCRDSDLATELGGRTGLALAHEFVLQRMQRASSRNGEYFLQLVVAFDLASAISDHPTQLVKMYGSAPKLAKECSCTADCTNIKKRTAEGEPNQAYVSTSCSALSLRTDIRPAMLADPLGAPCIEIYHEILFFGKFYVVTHFDVVREPLATLRRN